MHFKIALPLVFFATSATFADDDVRVDKRLKLPKVTTHCSAKSLEAKCCASALGQTACFVFEVNTHKFAIELSVEYNGNKYRKFTIGPQLGRVCLPTAAPKLCLRLNDAKFGSGCIRICGVVEVLISGKTIYTSPQLPCVKYKHKKLSIG